jgi:hypothetical protein
MSLYGANAETHKAVAPNDQSDAETLASLRPTRIDDPAAARGLHAGTESMGSHTLDLAGLVCSFHELTTLEPVYKSGGMLNQRVMPCQSLLSFTN